MARRNSLYGLKFAAGAAAVVIGGAAVGYLIGGRQSRPIDGISTVAPGPLVPPVSTTTASPSAPAPLRPRNGDYTAPGAPRIKIVEQKTPSLTDTSAATRAARSKRNENIEIPTPDVEASQEAPPSAPASTDTSTRSDASPKIIPPPPGDQSAAPTPASSDQDYERINPHSDSEASQEGARPSDTSGKAQYRVQIGSFEQAKNARILADALRDRGYTTSTRAEREGDKTIYKVQAGAYRTKDAANKSALELQKNGYPAYVSTINP